MSAQILLLDMDNVLLEPGGYDRALQETVARIGRSLGFRGARLTRTDIDVFESLGVTSEWESSAICVAAMLLAVWEHWPEVRLPADLPLPAPPPHDQPLPDFQALFRELAGGGEFIADAPAAAEAAFLARTANPDQAEALRLLLQGARDMRSLTHRIFQEFTLGSETFEATYHRRAGLASQSYLLKYDRSNLSPEARRRLEGWLEHPGRRAAIFTNRPSLAPDGFFSTPEAEQGARTVGVEWIPIVGHGALAWLAKERGERVQDLLKPSPVHALAGLRRALGDSLEQALLAAAEVAQGRTAGPGWGRLSGARITVFEDSAKGMVSAAMAGAALEARGIAVEMTYYGICQVEVKCVPLREVGASVFHDLEQALGGLPGWSEATA